MSKELDEIRARPISPLCYHCDPATRAEYDRPCDFCQRELERRTLLALVDELRDALRTSQADRSKVCEANARLHAERDALAREKAAALGLVAGHALTIERLEQERAALAADARRGKACDWSFIRRVLEQGMAIQQDNAAGKYPTYEHLMCRVDEAARERDEQLTALSAKEAKHASPQVEKG